MPGCSALRERARQGAAPRAVRARALQGSGWRAGHSAGVSVPVRVTDAVSWPTGPVRAFEYCSLVGLIE